MIAGIVASRLYAGASPSRLWTPLDLHETPKILLDWESSITESGGAVSNWWSRGSVGESASQTTASQQPALIPDAVGGKRALRFDGSNDVLRMSSVEARLAVANSADVVALAVLKKNALDASPLDRIVFRSNTASSGGTERFALRVGYTGSSNANKLHLGVRRLDGDSWSSQSSADAVDTGWHVVCMRQSYWTGIGTIYLDGEMVVSSQLTSIGLSSSGAAANPLSIGGHPSVNAAACANIDLAALIVCSSASYMSEYERQRLEGWAAWHCGLQEKLINEHPFKLDPPMV